MGAARNGPHGRHLGPRSDSDKHPGLADGGPGARPPGSAGPGPTGRRRDRPGRGRRLRGVVLDCLDNPVGWAWRNQTGGQRRPVAGVQPDSGWHMATPCCAEHHSRAGCAWGPTEAAGRSRGPCRPAVMHPRRQAEAWQGQPSRAGPAAPRLSATVFDRSDQQAQLAESTFRRSPCSQAICDSRAQERPGQPRSATGRGGAPMRGTVGVQKEAAGAEAGCVCICACLCARARASACM